MWKSCDCCICLLDSILVYNENMTTHIYVRSYEVMIARASRVSGVPDWINQNLSDFSKDGLRRSKRFKGQRFVSGLVSHLLVFQLVWDAASASLGLSPSLSHTSTLDISGPFMTS